MILKFSILDKPGRPEASAKTYEMNVALVVREGHLDLAAYVPMLSMRSEHPIGTLSERWGDIKQITFNYKSLQGNLKYISHREARTKVFESMGENLVAQMLLWRLRKDLKVLEKFRYPISVVHARTLIDSISFDPSSPLPDSVVAIAFQNSAELENARALKLIPEGVRATASPPVTPTQTMLLLKATLGVTPEKPLSSGIDSERTQKIWARLGVTCSVYQSNS